MSSSEQVRAGRTGAVLRVLPHGTVMIWDVAKARSYPFYKAGPDEHFREAETVKFVTDKTDTFVLEIFRSGRSGRRKALRPIVQDGAAAQRRAG